MSKSASIAALREDAARIFQAGINAADPFLAVKRCLKARDPHIEIALSREDNSRVRAGRWTKVHLIAFGKAACGMTQAASEIIPVHLLADDGIVVTNYENVAEIPGFTVIGAAHPLPDASGLEAAILVVDRLRGTARGELVLVLISGGGSALLPSPLPPVTLDDKVQTTAMLLGCGANINQINCVRKHLSCLKGGGLARLAAPADLHALILSDVLGDDLSSIASGPTVPDDTTFADAIEILQANAVWDRVPASVKSVLEQGIAGAIPETPKTGDSIFDRCGHTLVGSNTISLKSSADTASALGYEVQIYSEQLCGEAKDTAFELATYAKSLVDRGLERPTALLAGGETTVTLTGHGLGGRNQEMSLAFVLAAERCRLNGDWTFLSGGTDGRDGPTDAAGAIVDPQTLSRMREARVDPEARLADNDSHTALKSAGDLLMIGATGTNVADLQVLLLRP